MRLSTPPLCLACVAVLFPHPAAGQRVFAVQSKVTVRADSFGCEERAELDRLLQPNQSGGFTFRKAAQVLRIAARREILKRAHPQMARCHAPQYGDGGPAHGSATRVSS